MKEMRRLAVRFLFLVLAITFGLSASAFARDCGLPLTRIGRIRDGAGVALLLDGAPVEITGYDHFA